MQASTYAWIKKTRPIAVSAFDKTPILSEKCAGRYRMSRESCECGSEARHAY